MAVHAALAPSTGEADLLAETPGDRLIQRLDDPDVASSLSLILDHADLLAILIVSIDGLVRRAEVIGDSVSATVADARQGLTAATGQRSFPEIDVAALTDTVTRLAAAAADAAPALDRLVHSALLDPQTADLLAQAGDALLEGKRAAEADPRGPKGVFGLMRVTKDPDVSRGLGFMIQVARAFGKRLAPPAGSA
ncbi:DUF1641 domain-containing protein [Mycolicibacterium fluoranthenivorans]|uniref:DUF1641 domain-containing protein n=1 Tax=Mycolicibacterium fluoranthenivorans TaxID=258505 RepID=A0A1G4WZ69_9MYCO|nr:DUF1641 domain-containing protein [Mycolicibacterium fluoranthenivorans]SCX32610.1 Protein of unknown function [Mycolicibacterium fluoranthenivorans]